MNQEFVENIDFLIRKEVEALHTLFLIKKDMEKKPEPSLVSEVDLAADF